jgi:VWFA-related protein
VRHRAHVAFQTLADLLNNLEQVQSRRKALIYLSSGYDFNPIERTRLEDEAAKRGKSVEDDDFRLDPFTIDQTSQGMFNEADLVYELTYVTRLANRANVTMYTIDPRGLIAGQDVDEEVNYADWNDYVRETQMGLRMIADETRGFAIVNQNDFDKGLKQIDAETSDYYLMGFYSNNPDPLKRNRKLTIKVTGRDNLTITHRPAYLLKSNQRGRR